MMKDMAVRPLVEWCEARAEGEELKLLITSCLLYSVAGVS
jgi:hypothetical protein